jgi:hypothetical protein
MPEADLTSVRTLVTSVTKLAKHLGVAPASVYRWIKLNRLPGRFIIKIANLYDVELWDLIPLTGSDETDKSRVKNKSREILKTLMEVFKGKLTLDEAVTKTGSSPISLKLILTHWGDELPTLYTTLEQLDQDRITLVEACERLQVTTSTMHGIRRKYGYAPGHPVGTPKVKSQRMDISKEWALLCIAGRKTAVEAAHESGLSERTIFRAIERISPLSMNELSPWPIVFREAYVVELEQKLPNYAQKWLEFAREQRLFVDKLPEYMETPANWKHLPLKRLLIGVLMGEASLQEVAASKGTDPTILKTLFTGDLQPLGLTFDEVSQLPLQHQLALAEVFIAMMQRRRRFVEKPSRQG